MVTKSLWQHGSLGEVGVTHIIPRRNGLVLWLPLYRLQGSPIYSEEGRRHSCAVTGALWTPQGRSFIGGDDLINIDTALTSLAATTVGTWHIWAKLTDATPATAMQLVAFGDTNATEALRCFVNTDGKISFDCYLVGVQQWAVKTDAAAVSDNTFSFVSLVQDGTSPVIYINGAQPAQTFTVSTNKTRWFAACTGLDNGRIGCQNNASGGNTGFLTGTVGEVALYNNVKTLADHQNYRLATKWRYS